MTESVPNDVVTEQTPSPQSADTPADGARAGVRDFIAAFDFVKTGVEKLGAAAEDELKLLAKKYL